MGRATFRIPQRFLGDLDRLAKLIYVGTFGRPGNTPQEDGAVMRRIENVILMAWQTDKGSIWLGASFPGLFVSPELRGQDENILEAGGQHTSIGGHVQVIIDFIFPIEVRNP